LSQWQAYLLRARAGLTLGIGFGLLSAGDEALEHLERVQADVTAYLKTLEDGKAE
jgi:hypothetical protein